MFKVKNKDTRTISMTSLDAFIVTLEHISHLFLVFTVASKQLPYFP